MISSDLCDIGNFFGDQGSKEKGLIFVTVIILLTRVSSQLIISYFTSMFGFRTTIKFVSISKEDR